MLPSTQGRCSSKKMLVRLFVILLSFVGAAAADLIFEYYVLCFKWGLAKKLARLYSIIVNLV